MPYHESLPEIPPRPADGHKGTFGRVLIVGGSLGMSGAACLAGRAALRGGAGLVYVAVPSGILPIVAAAEPSYLTVPLPEDPATGRIARAAQSTLESAVEGKDSLAVGPGWGQSEDLLQLARWLYTSLSQPMVVDADGLNLLAQVPDVLSQHAGPRILTPHPGEFARLAGSNIGAVQRNRETMATEFAAEHDIVLVLKGPGTVVADGRRSSVNPTGNSGMATGGTGDVLTGLIAALLGQGMQAFEAAQLGAYLHGLAGDCAAKELSQPALIASDLPRYLSDAWKEVAHDVT